MSLEDLCVLDAEEIWGRLDTVARLWEVGIALLCAAPDEALRCAREYAIAKCCR